MPRLLTPGFMLFLLALVAFGLSINGVWQTDHSTSFVQLDYALWHDHSFALTSATRVPPWSVDDFVHNGVNYSALAPGAAFLALPFAGVGFTLAGGYTAFGPVLLMTEAFVALMGAVAAYLVYALARLYFRSSTSVLLGFAFAFSTTLWPMATYFFQSDVSAVFVVLSALLAVKAVRADGPAPTLASLSGLAAGAAFTTDYVDGVLIPVVFAFLVLGKRGSRGAMARSAAAFAAGALPGLVAIGFYNYSIFGNPLVTTEQSYRGTSSILSSFSTPPLYGLSLDLFSFSRGVFVFAPFLVLGVIGYLEVMRKTTARLEMAFFLAAFLAILIPYSMWYEPFGGLSFGPRFLVAAIPFLLLPAGYVVEQARRWKSLLVFGAYAAGVMMNGLGAVVIAIPVTNGFSDSPFTSVILPNLLAGNLDAFWAASTAYAPTVAVAFVAVFGVLIPLVWVERSRRNERALGEAPPSTSK